MSCSGDVSHFIADAIKEKLLPHFPEVDGVVALSHGSGCCHAPDSEGLAILRRSLAGGANLVCFTTGRGTVCGFRPVPTMKLATNSVMFNHLEGDMDVNCGRILDGNSDINQTGKEIFGAMLETASGKKTKSEELGFGGTEFVPWQMGAIL